jgi:hypothetical protein
VFSSVKTLFWRIYASSTIARVRKFLISAGFTIARARNFCKMHYSQVAVAFVRRENKYFLNGSRRRSFYGEVAFEWFGSYLLS